MRFHQGKMADAKPNSYTVHEAVYYTPQGSVATLVAVPYPYCADTSQVQQMCDAVVGRGCIQERQFCPPTSKRRDAIENTREVYPSLFQRASKREV